MYNALMKRKLGKKGFTLIELIVVIAIIAILAVILLPRFTGFTEDARKKAAVSDARNALVAVQAMQAQGGANVADGLTIAEINTYLGYTTGGLQGTLGATPNDISNLTDGTFTYTLGGYTVQVTNYVIGAVTP